MSKEEARIREVIAKTNLDAFIAPDDPLADVDVTSPTDAREFALAIRATCLTMYALGVDMGTNMMDCPNEALSYATAVVQRDRRENTEGHEFAVSLHVTDDPDLLAHAEALSEHFHLRPMSWVEFDAWTVANQKGIES